MIPTVKQWRVKSRDGRAWIVLAPTRVLARLNFRAEHWGPAIVSITPVRKQRTPARPGALVWRDK